MSKPIGVVYIVGPYRAATEHGVVENIRRAEQVALSAWRAGLAAICPHKNTALLGGACDDEVWLEGGIEIMKRCDGVLLVPGWEASEGSLHEVAVAHSLDIPAEHDPHILIATIAARRAQHAS